MSQHDYMGTTNGEVWLTLVPLIAVDLLLSWQSFTQRRTADMSGTNVNSSLLVIQTVYNLTLPSLIGIS